MPFGDDLERVNVEAAVGLVEQARSGFTTASWKDLVALLLAAGESFVHRAVHERLFNSEHPLLFFHQLDERDGV
jgi:hypothetical protein